MKFTKTNVSKLSIDNGKKEQVFFDDELPGLVIRVREAGSRNYAVYCRQGGVQRRHMVGNVAVLSLDDARIKARKMLVAIDEGRDPAIEKAAKQAASKLFFSAVSADYLEALKSSVSERWHVECTRHLNKDWKPLHSLPVGSMSRATVASRLREIGKTSGSTAANRARGTLSAMYAWAIGEGLCETNPVDGTNKAEQAKPRKRVLTDAELATVWTKAPANDYGRIVRLLALTAQRRDEIASLQWSELKDLDDAKLARIELPGERTKNGRDHVVPLSVEAVAILKGCIPRKGRSLVFGEGEGPFSGWSAAKRALDKAAGVKGWVLHDLRRTGATRMGDSGVQPHVIEAVLNHVSGHKAGVAGVYNWAAYEPEKRAALDTLASYIKTAAAKAAGGNVTRLKRA